MKTQTAGDTQQEGMVYGKRTKVNVSGQGPLIGTEGKLDENSTAFSKSIML